jgi:hypothetical protein
MGGTINAESAGNLTFHILPYIHILRQSIIHQMAKPLEEEEVDLRRTLEKQLTR